MHSLKVDIKSKLFLVPSVAFYTFNLALYFARHTECELLKSTLLLGKNYNLIRLIFLTISALNELIINVRNKLCNLDSNDSK